MQKIGCEMELIDLWVGVACVFACVFVVCICGGGKADAERV